MAYKSLTMTAISSGPYKLANDAEVRIVACHVRRTKFQCTLRELKTVTWSVHEIWMHLSYELVSG